MFPLCIERETCKKDSSTSQLSDKGNDRMSTQNKMSVRSFYCIDFNSHLFFYKGSILKDKCLLAIRQTTGCDNSTSLFLALLHRLWISSSNFKVFHRIAIIRPVLVMPCEVTQLLLIIAVAGCRMKGLGQDV